MFKNHKIAAGVIGAVIPLVIATAAVAGEDGSLSSTSGSVAKFYHYGDYINVCDTSGGDPNGAYAQYSYHYETIIRRTSGNVRYGGCEHKSTGNPTEGWLVRYRAAFDIPAHGDVYGAWMAGRA